MKNSEWPADEVKRIAQTSGKPLEVKCAEAFLAAGWKARLGSHFADGALDVTRELDVLAERVETLSPIMSLRVRALVSCKGFPADRSPLAYSVSQASVPSFSPRLPSSFRSRSFMPGQQQTYGSLDALEEPAASLLLNASGLVASRPLVAFDQIERTERELKKGKKDSKLVEYKRSNDGDRALYGGIDSCIKAAIYWCKADFQQPPLVFAALNVPVCVLSLPFWDVSIDGGQVGKPEVKQRGYQSHAYPGPSGSKEVMALVWSVEDLPALVRALDELHGWFLGQISDIAEKMQA